MTVLAGKEKQRTKVASGRHDRHVRVGAISVAALVALYVAGLINPFTGPALQYPYYELFCGKKPVVAWSFMGKSFKTPGMRSYRPPSLLGLGSDKLYCTENEAMSHGYGKSLAR